MTAWEEVAMKYPRLRTWLKASQNDGDQLPHVIQKLDHRPVRVDRYVAGELGLQISVRVRAARDDRQAQHLLITAGNHATVDFDAASRVGVTVEPCPGVLIKQFTDNDVSDVHSTVLVYVRKTGEDSEGGNFQRLRSFVRLELFDESRVILTHEPKMPVLAGTPFERVSDDRELHIPGLAFDRVASEAPDSELPSQVVKCTPEVVNCISDDERPMIAHYRNVFNTHDNAPRFVVVRSPERNDVRIRLPSFSDLVPKLVDVTFSAVELGPTAGKVEAVGQATTQHSDAAQSSG